MSDESAKSSLTGYVDESCPQPRESGA